MADQAKDKYVTDVRNAIEARWDNFSLLQKLRLEGSSRGWDGAISDANIDGENYDITAAAFSDALGSIDAEVTFMNSGHKTNYAKMIKR